LARLDKWSEDNAFGCIENVNMMFEDLANSINKKDYNTIMTNAKEYRNIDPNFVDREEKDYSLHTEDN